MSNYLQLKKSNCKNCYKCIRNCPVKSIRFSGNQAHIIGDECILCGQCFVVCPQNAKEIVGDTEKVKVLMQSNPVVVSLAPSFAANYEGVGIEAMTDALKQLGFFAVEETAVGATISFDPNLRENLWDCLDTAAEKIRWGLSQCDILKISDNEIQWITGENNFDKAVRVLKEKYDIPLIFLSLGADGSRAYSYTGYAESPVFDVDTIEKTGAGDTFCGCVLSKILEYGMRDYSSDELENMLRFANAGAAIVTTRKGALKVMPTSKEITDIMGGEA